MHPRASPIRDHSASRHDATHDETLLRGESGWSRPTVNYSCPAREGCSGASEASTRTGVVSLPLPAGIKGCDRFHQPDSSSRENRTHPKTHPGPPAQTLHVKGGIRSAHAAPISSSTHPTSRPQQKHKKKKSILICPVHRSPEATRADSTLWGAAREKPGLSPSQI